MVGVGGLIELSRWLEPVTTVLVGAAILIYIRVVIQPRLKDVEATQENREQRLTDHELSGQERDLVLDDTAERVDQVDEAVGRLKKRVRALEQAYAVEHGREPRKWRGAGGRDGSDSDDDPDEPPDDATTDGGDPDDGDLPGAKAAARRLKRRVDAIRQGQITPPSRCESTTPTGAD